MKTEISKKQKIFILIFCVILIYGISLFGRNHLWIRDAEAYCNVMLPAVLKPWNAQALLETLSDESKQEVSSEEYKKFALSTSEKLGNLVSMDPPKCKLVREEERVSRDERTFALCWTQAKFDKSTQDLGLHLIRDHGGNWSLRDLVFTQK